MPRKITTSQARDLVRTRELLRLGGRTERDIHAQVQSNELIRIRRDRYVSREDWEDLWGEGRHLVQVVSVYDNSDAPGPVFVGPSAAVLHGLPLYRLAPRYVHAAILGTRHSRTRADVKWHDVALAAEDIVEVGGIRCTSIDRTALDLARSVGPSTAISALDAALRAEAVDGQVQDAERAVIWHERMRARATAEHGRGIIRARDLIEFADGRAQLPGESVSRLHLRELGFAPPMLQVRVLGPSGEEYWLDFGFEGVRCFGEFDGKSKYLDPAFRSGRTIEEAVLDEKRREDIVRGVTGWGVRRWGSEHLTTARTLGARLAAFGIRPPG